MSGSNFVQATPYLLVEYVYGDTSTKYLGTQVKLAKLQNDHENGEITFLNTLAAMNTTGNILDYTGANLGGADWVLLDKDVPTPYITQDDDLTYTDMTALLSSLDVTYDTIRFHFQSGWNFDNTEGVLLRSYVDQSQTDLKSYLTSSVVLRGTDRFVLNPKPLFITDRVYDRYIEIMVPSVKEVNTDFYADPTNPVSIGYQYTTDNRGYKFNTQIYVDVYEIPTITTTDGIVYFKTGTVYNTLTRQEDIYGSVAATIKESSDGDYFEYYASVDGGFPDDFIQDMNSRGGNYVIVHEIDVVEQVDTRFVTTSSFTQVQESNFDEPMLFRPILKYAGIAVSFSVDYTVRVYNTVDNTQIVKSGSVSSYVPAKYGKQLDKINLSDVTNPLKVYNKVYTNSPLSMVQLPDVNQYSTVYVPVFYDMRNLFVGNKSVMEKGKDVVDSAFNSETVNFAQGAARIYIGDFDSYIKFFIKQYVASNSSLTEVDLTGLSLHIGFNDITGKVFKYPAISSTTDALLANGEVFFKIPAEAKGRMGLDGTKVKSFYIISEAPDLESTRLYIGTVDIEEMISKEPDRIKEIGDNAITAKDLTDKPIKKKPPIKDSVAEKDIQKELNAAIIGTSTATKVIVPTYIPGLTKDPIGKSAKSIKPVTKTKKVKTTPDPGTTTNTSTTPSTE